MQNQKVDEITMIRVFHAPRELVFRAFSEPEQVWQWWGPTGWMMPVCTIDFRPGGEWHYCIANAVGEEHCATAIYHTIVPPQEIVFSDAMVDAQGKVIGALPKKRTSVIFEDLGGKNANHGSGSGRLTRRSREAAGAGFQAGLWPGARQPGAASAPGAAKR